MLCINDRQYVKKIGWCETAETAMNHRLHVGAIAMNNWTMSRIAVECERTLGMTVSTINEPDEVYRILKDMGKEFVSPILDPKMNDFTPANAFWLVAEKDGEPLIAGGVRFDDLRDLSVQKYWDRMLSRVFGQRPMPANYTFPSHVLQGRIAYFGDLFSKNTGGMSRHARRNLRLFTGIGHYMAHREFDPDVTYCFVQDRDVQRGTPLSYGFLENHPFFYDWDTDPYPAGYPEWISCTRRAQVQQLMGSLERVIAV